MIPHSRPWILPEDIDTVQKVLQERAVCSWHHAEELATALALFSQAANCRLFATGTLALCAALRDLKLPIGSAVGIPAFTCLDVLRGVVSVGYQPVILDCDERGLLSTEEALHSYQQGWIQAMVCVHQFGLINRGIAPLAARMPVVEDCSHVPPGFYLENSIAAFGSLEGTKLLGAGEGGYYLLRESDGHADGSLIDLANVGNRLSDVLAALAICQLHRLKANLKRRDSIATSFMALCPPERVVDGERGAWFRFLVRMDSNQAVEALIANGQAAGIVLKRPIMPHPLHRRSNHHNSDCPMADRLWDTLISIPIFPALSYEEVSVVERFLYTHLMCNNGSD